MVADGSGIADLRVFYVTPFYDVFEPGGPLALRKIKSTAKYAIYTNLTDSSDSPLAD